VFCGSGWWDLNPRPLRPERGHMPMPIVIQCQGMLLAAHGFAVSGNPRQAVARGLLPFCCPAGHLRRLRGVCPWAGWIDLPLRPVAEHLGGFGGCVPEAGSRVSGTSFEPGGGLDRCVSGSWRLR
jgi:hypothetical protein